MSQNRKEQNIARFIDVFKQGARPNRFRVDVLDLPTTIEPFLLNAIGNRENFYFYCKAASIPEDSIGVVEVPFMGRKFKVHGDRVFNEWSITVFNEDGNLQRRFFERWMHGINTHRSNIRTLGGISDYKNDASYYARFKVTQLRVDGEDEIGRQSSSYIFNYVFPSNLAAIDLAYDTNDTIEEFAVTLQYSWWGVSDNSLGTDTAEDNFFG